MSSRLLSPEEMQKALVTQTAEMLSVCPDPVLDYSKPREERDATQHFRCEEVQGGFTIKEGDKKYMVTIQVTEL